jgi:IPT/TIG domain
MKINAILFFCCLLLASACTKKEVRPLLPAPKVTEIKPASAKIGETVVVLGKGFLSDPSANIVSFGGKLAVISSVTGDSELSVIVPNGAVSGNIVVGNANSSTTGPVFTVLINPNPPTIVSVSDQNMEVGEVIEITGTNFIAKVDTSANQVQLGNKRLLILKATATKLAALVPAGTIGANQDLIVTVGGAASNAVKVTVKGFAGSLFWTLLPTDNKPVDNVHQLIAKLAADGSSSLNNRGSVAIPDDSAQNKSILKYLLEGPKTFDAKTNLLYYPRAQRDTLWKLTSPDFTRFEKVFGAGEVDAPLNKVTALTVNENNQDLFFAYSTIINRGADFFGFVLSGTIVQMVAAHDALYLLVRNAGVSTLQKIPYTTADGMAEIVNTSSLPIPASGTIGITSIHYSMLSKNLYIVFQDKPSGCCPVKLYQLVEADGTVKLLADNLPQLGNQDQSKFAMLDAPTGPKLYGIGFVTYLGNELPDDQVLYTVNLKPNANGNYGAVVLYRDLLKLADYKETFQYEATTSFELPFKKVDFLFADDN